jgi:hypothetical protein
MDSKKIRDRSWADKIELIDWSKVPDGTLFRKESACDSEGNTSVVLHTLRSRDQVFVMQSDSRKVCKWCGKELPENKDYRPENYCSFDHEAAQHEHVRDLYDEGRGDAEKDEAE